MAGLIFTTILIVCRRISPAGPLRDVNAGCTKGFQNLFKGGTTCAVSSGAGHFRSNFWRYSRANLRRDFALLPHCLGAGEAWEKEFLKLSLIEINKGDYTILSRSWTSVCATTFSSVNKEVLNEVAIFYLVRKYVRCKISLSGWKITTERFWLQKRGEELVLPFV